MTIWLVIAICLLPSVAFFARLTLPWRDGP